MNEFAKSIANKPTSTYDHDALFVKELGVEIERAKRYKRPLSLLFFAIEDLNDNQIAYIAMGRKNLYVFYPRQI
jgi:hypothetical protein